MSVVSNYHEQDEAQIQAVLWDARSDREQQETLPQKLDPDSPDLLKQLRLTDTQLKKERTLTKSTVKRKFTKHLNPNHFNQASLTLQSSKDGTRTPDSDSTSSYCPTPLQTPNSLTRQEVVKPQSPVHKRRGFLVNEHTSISLNHFIEPQALDLPSHSLGLETRDFQNLTDPLFREKKHNPPSLDSSQQPQNLSPSPALSLEIRDFQNLTDSLFRETKHTPPSLDSSQQPQNLSPSPALSLETRDFQNLTHQSDEPLSHSEFEALFVAATSDDPDDDCPCCVIL